MNAQYIHEQQQPKYQRYAEYKDSGIVWMGNVPKHWTSERFKWSLTEKLKTSNPNLPAGSISFGEVIYKNEENLSSDTKASYQEVLKDEFLINPLNLNYDLKSLRTALSKIDVVVSTGYIVLHCNHLLDRNYVRWLLQEFDVAHMKTLGAGVRQTVNFSDIANCYFYLPEQLEQRKIANFLDHETAKIDSLIEKQQQLIQLLKEKRQAVISHAVTKGLDPRVKMKDSGVEWLGEVPEHWEVLPIKYLTKCVGTGGTPKNQISFTEVPEINWFTPGDFSGDLEIIDSSKYVTFSSVKDGDSKLYEGKSVLMIGIGATLGKVAISNKDFSCNQQINVLTCNKLITPEFLKFSLMSQLEQIKQLSNSSTIGIINQEKTKQICISVPTVEEQSEIIHFIMGNIEKFNNLINKAESAIQLMQERRTALISAAVTGKIDVRNWQNPTEAKMEFSA